MLAQSSGRKCLAKVALNHARPISRRLILTKLNSRHQTKSSGLTVVSRRDFLSNFRGITSRALDAFTAKDWEGASRLCQFYRPCLEGQTMTPYSARP